MAIDGATKVGEGRVGQLRVLASFCLAMTAVLALVSCRSGASGTSGNVAVPKDTALPEAAPAALPGSCVELLAKLQCWLRASGDPPADVARAVGNARASLAKRLGASESCNQTLTFRAARFASAGCASSDVSLSNLPPAAAIECPPGEFFFVRQDGHLSGCHRDCTVSADCPAGSTCSSVGSAAGGPTEEQFCE